jgi:streptogramin lyase
MFVAAMVIATVSTCAVARAGYVVNLGLDKRINSLVVAPDGSAWIGIGALRGHAEIGHVAANGHFSAVRVQTVSSQASGFGLEAALAPGGEVWLDDFGGWLYRVAPGRAVVQVGPIHGEEIPGALAFGGDGTLWSTLDVRNIVHVAEDGTQWSSPIAAPSCSSSFALSMARATDGAMWIADDGCQRLLRVAPGGTTSVIGLGNAHGLALSPTLENGMWFGAANEGLVGHVTAVGNVASFRALHAPNTGLATAPDGSAWYSSDLECGVTHIAQDGEQQHFRAPLVPQRVAFGPDGSLWLASSRRVLHIDLAALRRRSSCDKKPPVIVERPRLRGRIAWRSLSHGFTIHVDEPADIALASFFWVNGRPLRTHVSSDSPLKIARGRPWTVHVSLPAALVGLVGRYVNSGANVTMSVFINATDHEGNTNFAKGSGNELPLSANPVRAH